MLEIPFNYSSFKCGEIHCYNAIQFSITCNYCGFITNSFAQFCEHYKDEHFEPPEMEAATDHKLLEMNTEASEMVSSDDNVELSYLKEEDEEFELISNKYYDLPEEEIHSFPKQATSSIDATRCFTEIEIELNVMPMERTTVEENVSEMISSDENVELSYIKKEVDLKVEEFEEINFSPKQIKNSIDEGGYLTEIETEFNLLPMETTSVAEENTQKETTLHHNEHKEKVQHIKQKHKSKYNSKKMKQTTGRVFKCKHCEKPFNIKSNRNMHELRHNEIGDFHCNLCTKIFYTKDELTKHLRSHNDERPYVCEQCGKAFRHLWVLKKHSLTHSIQVRTLPCPKCGKLFASKDNLRCHLPVHNTIPIFDCEYCDQCFTSRKRLWTHSHRRHSHKNS